MLTATSIGELSYTYFCNADNTLKINKIIYGLFVTFRFPHFKSEEILVFMLVFYILMMQKQARLQGRFQFRLRTTRLAWSCTAATAGTGRPSWRPWPCCYSTPTTELWKGLRCWLRRSGSATATSLTTGSGTGTTSTTTPTDPRSSFSSLTAFGRFEWYFNIKNVKKRL